LLLLGLLATAGLLATTVAVGFAGPTADCVGTTERRLADVVQSASVRHRIVGTLPSRLGSLAVAQPTLHWQRDPWAAPSSLRLGLIARDLEVRSVGPDRRLRTADDVVARLDDEPLLRMRQRATLRILRAVFAASRFRRGDGMSPETGAQVVAAMREAAAIRRAWYFASAQERATLSTRLDAARDTLESLGSAYGLPALPTQMRGRAGLPSALGLPDARCVDGLGRRLTFDPLLGFVAAGGDRVGGTDDDM
jgi:hypothetical protein